MASQKRSRPRTKTGSREVDINKKKTRFASICSEHRTLAVELLEPRLVLSSAPWSEYSQVSASWFAQNTAPVSTLGTQNSPSPEPDLNWIVRVGAEHIDSTTSVSEAAQLITGNSQGLQVVRGLGLPGLLFVTSTGMDTEDVASIFASNENIAHFEQEVQLQGALTTPNDELFGQQAGLDNSGQDGGQPGADINAELGWDVTTGDRRVISAVLDSGADYTHVDLAENIWINQGEIPSALRAAILANDAAVDNDGIISFVDLNDPLNSSFVTDGNLNGYIDAEDLLSDSSWADGVDDDLSMKVDDLIGWDFRNNDNEPLDDHGHGTHVAGTLGAVGNNEKIGNPGVGEGVSGVAWEASIMVLKFLGENNTGSTLDAIEAVNYATMMRTRSVDPVNVRVLNNSWGTNVFSEGLKQAIAASAEADTLFVAAAGNGNIFGGVDNDTLPFYPASYDSPNILSVGASDRLDGIARFSNFGETTVDILAPGVGVTSTERGDLYGSRSGTSMATPHVSGVAALLYSEELYGQNREAAAVEVKAAILASAEQLPALLDTVVSDGRLDAEGVFLQDTFSPKPALGTAPDITTFSSTPQSITVDFGDATAIDVSTLDSLDVIITKLDDSGDTFSTTFDSVDIPSNGTMRTATYLMQPPGGTWDTIDNGDYEISIAAGEVGDTLGNLTLSTVIGQFSVTLGNPGEFFVDSTLDSVDANPGDGNAIDASGNRTLRAAIQEANATAGDNTIYIGSGTYTLNLTGSGEDLSATGDLDITVGTLTIIGAGADKTIIDGADLDRVFDLRPGVTVTLADVTVTGGDVIGNGGAILVDGATLTLSDVAVMDSNASGGGGGIYSTSGKYTQR